MESNLKHKITNTIWKNLLGADKKSPDCKAKKEGPQPFTSKINNKTIKHIHPQKQTKNQKSKQKTENKIKTILCNYQFPKKTKKERNQEGTPREQKDRKKLIAPKDNLKHNENIFFEKSLYSKYKNPCFYGPPKLHKAFLNNFPKMCTVVAKIKSFMEIISKYIDYYLSKLIPFVVTHLKDSFTLIEDLNGIQKPLPQICLLPTADTISMYTNIHTDHDITTVEKYMNITKDKLEQDFPHILLIKFLTILLKQNTFTFGDWFFLQKQGTAMGITCAVKYATIYCA